MMHPTMSEANTDPFTDIGKVYKNRALLECERKFFDNETEEIFVESNTNFFMNLTDR